MADADPFDPEQIVKVVAQAVAAEVSRSRGTAWKEVRGRVLMAGMGFFILDLSVTLTVIILSGAHTRQVDKLRAQASCRNTALLAGAFAQNYAGQQAQTAEILKTPSFTLNVTNAGRVIGTVQMPIFGFPPAQLKALSESGKQQNTALLTSLRSIQHADCKGLAPPKLAKAGASGASGRGASGTTGAATRKAGA